MSTAAKELRAAGKLVNAKTCKTKMSASLSDTCGMPCGHVVAPTRAISLGRGCFTQCLSHPPQKINRLARVGTHSSATITVRDRGVLAHAHPHYPLKPLVGEKSVSHSGLLSLSIIIILSYCLCTGAASKCGPFAPLHVA